VVLALTERHRPDFPYSFSNINEWKLILLLLFQHLKHIEIEHLSTTFREFNVKNANLFLILEHDSQLNNHSA
jgi:hypothetical protein